MPGAPSRSAANVTCGGIPFRGGSSRAVRAPTEGYSSDGPGRFPEHSTQLEVRGGGRTRGLADVAEFEKAGENNSEE